MFAKILYVDIEKALIIQWFGLGALQVKFRNGRTRQAHPVQKQILLSIITHFENCGQSVHPSNPKCMALLKMVCELVCESPNSIAWQLMLSADLRDVAEAYATDK